MNTVKTHAAVINDQFTYKYLTLTLIFTLSKDVVYIQTVQVRFIIVFYYYLWVDY